MLHLPETEGVGTQSFPVLHDVDGQRVEVIEVDRPNRQTRRLVGKPDPIDAVIHALMLSKPGHRLVTDTPTDRDDPAAGRARRAPFRHDP
jgi:hypothetical protein